MAYSKTVPYSGGGTLYAKPVTDGSLPSSTPTWATDVVATASSNGSGVTFTGLTDGQAYWVFTQAGGSPASTDLVYATFRDDRGDVRAAVGSETTVIVGTQHITRITRNDSYDGTANAVKSFVVTKDYTGWTGTLTIRHRVLGTSLLSKSVSVATATSLTASLSSSDTAFADLTSDEDFGPHPFDIEMVSGSSKQTAVNGIAIITKDRTYT